MDIQKEREAFEAWLKSLNENGRTTYFLGQESTVAWEAWQAAKANAVPDGYVVVPKEPTLEMLECAADEHVLHGASYAGIYNAMIQAAQESAND